jgi:phosphoserine phosphatase RsbU/P
MLANPILPTILFMIGVFNLILGIVVFRENPKRLINRVTGFLMLFASLGAIFNAISPSVVFIISSQQISNFSIRLSLLWEMVFPLLLYFSLLFPRKNELLVSHSQAINVLFVAYLLRFLLVVFFPSADFLDDFLVLKAGDGFWGSVVRPISMALALLKNVVGTFYRIHHFLFIILNTVCVVLAIFFMVQGYLKLSDRLTKKRVGLVIFGIGLGVLFFGIAILLPYVNGPKEVKSTSYLFFVCASILLTASISWAIYKYQFLNIRMVIRRGLVSSLIAVFLVVLFLLLYNHTKGLLASIINTDVPVFEILFLLIAVFFFQPLTDILINLLDKIFYQKSFSHENMTKIGRELLSASQPESIYQNTLPLVQSYLGAKRLDLFIGEKNYFKDNYHQGNSNISFSKEGEISNILLDNGKAMAVDQLRVQLSDSSDLTNLETLKAELIFPVLNRNSLVGILFLSAKLNGESYYTKEIELLEFMSLQMGIAFENIRLYKIAQAQRLLEEELSVASHIQRMLLPLEIPTGKSFEIASINIPSKEVGGDYHDFIRLPENKLGIAIGDIAGKGVPGAILMSNLQASLRAHAPVYQDPAAVVSEVNRLLARTTSSEKYATFLYAVYDEDSKTLTLCNAGHNYPLIKRAKGECEIIKKGNPIIGVDEKIAYNSFEIELDRNDMVFFYTDGITEALNINTEEYGEDRLINFIRTNKDSDVQQIKNRVYDDILAFTTGTSQYDDITFIVLQVK